jgi:hypothetical protein
MISVGYSQGTPSIPLPKATWYKKEATEAEQYALSVSISVSAKWRRMVMTRKDTNCPDPERSMRPRRPKRSIIVTAMQEDMK